MWKGQYCGQEVAVQMLRVYRQSDYERIRRVGCQQSTQPTVHTNSCISQRFCKEVVTWKALHHPNVMPLLGVTMTETQFMMASEWVDNGNINEFVKADANVNRLELVCCVPKLFSLPSTDGYTITVAQRCHQGTSVHAWPGNSPWRSQRGMYV